MIAAIYARKSTEQSGADADARSVARQIENARAFAASKGWTIAERHIYADDGISGAETKRLLAKQRMLDVIATAPPFDVLIVQAQDRLSRRDGDEAFGELKRIAAAGVAVWFYAERQQFTYGDLASNVTGFLRGEFAAEFRRAIAAKTYEAMERKARAGHVTGGRVFGYDYERVNGHVERRINETEAAVIRQIFQLSAAGHGVKSIAKALNAQAAPSPRAQLGRSQTWSPKFGA